MRRSLWRRAIWAVVALFSLGMALLPPRAATSTTGGWVERTYSPDDTVIANPERGFNGQYTPFWIGSVREPLEVAELRALRAEGMTTTRAYFVIDEARRRPLTEAELTAIEADFATARRAGVKLIPRFAYNFPTNDGYTVAIDAPLARVLAHIEQLRPLLRANADVIAYMETGFVGAWGEWHSSSNGLVSEQGLTDASRAILAALLDALPPERMIALRYPALKQQLFGPRPLRADHAWSGSAQARIGAHNDCFLASDTDWGTYEPQESPADIERYKRYLAADNLFLVQGGESCNVAEDAQPYIGCANALTELERMRWSTINATYHEEVLALWQEQGCYDEIARHLGYRLRLLRARAPATLSPGAPLPLELTLANDGWASLYNARPLEIVLRHRSSDALTVIPTGVDLRLLRPGETRTLRIETPIPAVLEAGEVDLLVWMPDMAPSLRARAEYAVRLANEGLWEPDTGMNDLGIRVEVVAPEGGAGG